jgi:hypothetical protein
MRVTDVIRGILDLIDRGESQETAAPAVAVEIEPADDLAVIQQLAGVPAEPEYANEPNEMVARLGAAFPAGDDMHHSKNPADIRTNAPSMYPGYQAERR